MADEEIGKILYRFDADIQGLKDALAKIAEGMKAQVEIGKQVTESIKKQEEAAKSYKESLDALAGGIKGVAGQIKWALGGIKTANDLMKGGFESTGQAMGKLGELAAMIPGPWGQAASAVLSVGGAIVDYFEGPLNKAKEAAKSAFMSIASGARTSEQAVHDVAKSVMSEQLGKAADRSQEGWVGSALQSIGVRDTSEDVVSKVPKMIQQRRELMQSLLSDPVMTQLRRQMAAEDIGQGLVDRPREMEMHAVRRRQMMAMHRPARGAEEIANAERMVEVETRRLTLMDYRRRTGADVIAGSAEELRLNQSIVTGVAGMLDNMRRGRAERLTEELAHATTQHGQHTREMLDKTTVLRATQQGAGDIQVKHLEAQLKIERELFDLRQRGATDPQLNVRRGQLEDEAAQRLLNESIQDGIRITTQMQSPMETYNLRLDHLQIRLAQNSISQITYNNALAAANQTLRQHTPEVQAYVHQVEAGVSVVAGFADPMDKFIVQQRQLDEAFYAGRITLEERAIALERLQRQLDGVNASMQGIQGTARGSAAALALATSYQRGLQLRAEDPNHGLDRNDPRLPISDQLRQEYLSGGDNAEQQGPGGLTGAGIGGLGGALPGGAQERMRGAQMDPAAAANIQAAARAREAAAARAREEEEEETEAMLELLEAQQRVTEARRADEEALGRLQVAFDRRQNAIREGNQGEQLLRGIEFRQAEAARFQTFQGVAQAEQSAQPAQNQMDVATAMSDARDILRQMLGLQQAEAGQPNINVIPLGFGG